MKVISTYKWSAQITCQKGIAGEQGCSSVLEINQEDIKKVTQHTKSGEVSYHILFVQCPICHMLIEIDPVIVPDKIVEELYTSKKGILP